MTADLVDRFSVHPIPDLSRILPNNFIDRDEGPEQSDDETELTEEQTDD